MIELGKHHWKFVHFTGLHCKPILCNENRISLYPHSHMEKPVFIKGNHVLIAGILFSKYRGFPACSWFYPVQDCSVWIFVFSKTCRNNKKVCSSHNSYFFILLSNYNSSHHSVYLQLDKRWKIDLSRCVKLFPAQHHFHDECSHHMILMRGWHTHRSSSHSVKFSTKYYSNLN